MSDCNFEVVPGNQYPEHEFHGTLVEQTELIKCILNNFDNCKCHKVPDMWGRVVEIHMCPAHQFLNEHDMPGRTLEWTQPRGLHYVTGGLNNCVARSDRLMFARSQRTLWQAQEGLISLYGQPDAGKTTLVSAEDFNW